MKRIALALLAITLCVASASAQVIPPGTNPVPAGAAYNSSPPTLTSGQAGYLQVDSTGNLRTVSSGSPSGTQNVNLTQILSAAPSLTNPLWILPGTGASFAVTGTFFQATQPVSGTFFQATQPVSIAAAPLLPIGITPTDRTITSASGASQQIMAANASRHSLTIENTGNANCGVNPTGGTAAIGGAGTLTIAPLGAYTPRVPTLSAVTVICTAAQPIYGDEN